MKIFIVFTLIAITFSVNAADTTEQDKLVEEHIKKCQEEFPTLTKEELDQLREGKMTNPNENVQCFVNCFMEESGLIKNGVSDQETSIKKFAIRVGDYKAKQGVDECSDQSGPGKCETPWKLYSCYQQKGLF